MSKKGRRKRGPQLPPGYTLKRLRGGHFQILRPDGEPLRKEGGLPINVSFSPSDWRTGKNEAAIIRKAIENLESQVREETNE